MRKESRNQNNAYFSQVQISALSCGLIILCEMLFTQMERETATNVCDVGMKRRRYDDEVEVDEMRNFTCISAVWVVLRNGS